MSGCRSRISSDPDCLGVTMTTSEWRPAIVPLLVLTGVTGIAYPLAITGLAGVAFGDAVGGSLIEVDGKSVASRLIGQNFSDPKYFWSRPSATAPMPYNGAASGGSNQGPLNPALTDAVRSRIEALRAAYPAQTGAVPVDLVTASASGLDPHLSVAGDSVSDRARGGCSPSARRKGTGARGGPRRGSSAGDFRGAARERRRAESGTRRNVGRHAMMCT